MFTKSILNKTQEEALINAIRKAEAGSTGEIRIHIEKKCKGETLKRASEVFTQLKMENTAERNGVLLYLAWQSRDFAVIGDIGIHNKVGQEFWENIYQSTIVSFANQNFAEGLLKAVETCGEQLKHHFPVKNNNPNELSDEVSFGK